MVFVGDGRYNIPDDLAYTIQHVYINSENGKIGLDELGIDFIAKPKEIEFLQRDKVEKGKPFASIAIENGMVTLNSPVSGNIKEINTEALKNLDQTYDKGYLLIVSPTNLEADLGDLIKGDKIEEWAKKEAQQLARIVFNYKIIEVGDSTVGKTAIKVRFTDDYFKKDLKSTLGVDFGSKEVHFDYFGDHTMLGVEKITAKLNIWDTGGQEAYGGLRKMYYKEARGCLVVFDVTNAESFDHVPKWIDELYGNIGPVPVLLVGNKIDLEDQRKIATDTAKKFAKEKGYLYIETSALTGENVVDAFTKLAKLIYETKKI
ncbi:MAG: GTP-binding protein [Candidatus Hodarchaeota archaeon]